MRKEIEKYINGELDASERIAFENQMQEDPVFHNEVRKWQSVAGVLSRLRITDKVKEVDAERTIWLRQRMIRRIITSVLLLGVASVITLLFLKKILADAVPTVTPQDLPQQQEPARQQASPEPAIEELLPPTVLTKPIAEGPKNKAAEKPLLRSINPQLDSATTLLIDKLLKMTEYNTPNTSYDRNQEWKKCVAALRKSNPSEAKEWIYKMDPGAPEAQWLMGIALLEEGKTDDALAIFEKIAGNENHSRQKYALPAVEALRR